MSKQLTAERLRELLHYSPETGVFRWLASRPGHARPGDLAGTVDRHGYIRIAVGGGKPQAAHRLAWLYVHATWPDADIDHEDGNRKNNSIRNLRQCSRAQNLQNMSLGARNTSGLLGVGWHKGSSSWRARITVNYEDIYLGLFDTPEEAHAAYLAAKAKLHTFNPVPRKATTGTSSNDQPHQTAARG